MEETVVDLMVTGATNASTQMNTLVLAIVPIIMAITVLLLVTQKGQALTKKLFRGV